MFKLLLPLLLCVWSVCVAFGQTVIINGDFETPPYETNGAITGWDVTGHVGEVSGEGFTSASHAAAFSIGGDSDGNTLAQTFSTLAGQSYTIDFDAGVVGMRTGGPLSLQIQVFGLGNATLVDDTIIPPYNGTFGAPTFAHYVYTFMADGPATTLKFTDIGLGNGSADIVLDTVSVVPISPAEVPEPATVILLGVGGIFLAARLGKSPGI